MPELSSSMEIADALLTVIRLMRREIDIAMSTQGLSLARGKLLFTIEREGPTRPSTLANLLDQAPRSITDAIDALERDGLVERRQDTTDRRAQLIALSPAGVKALRAAEKPKQKALEKFFAALDEPQKKNLLSALRTVGRDAESRNV